MAAFDAVCAVGISRLFTQEESNGCIAHQRQLATINRSFVPAAIAIAALFATLPALADDWQVTKLRGAVQQQLNGQWVDLKRGDIIADDTTVRTLDDGHVDLQRGQEVVSLGAGSQIRIHDNTDAQYTTVQEDFGSVEVDAEAKNFAHFEVQTQFLAAVVKGTHFVVTAGPTSAQVAVSRGAVAVQSRVSQRSTTVTIGQVANVAPGRPQDIVVSGVGPLPQIVDGPISDAPAAGSLSDLRGPMGTTPSNGPSGQAASGTQMAMVVPPLANPGVPGRVNRALDGAGLAQALLQSTGPSRAKDPPLNFGIIWIGALVGAAIGALALLWRRYL
jgi:hypothetical protein